MNPRIPHLVNGALVAALLGASALAWPGLPARIPMHFDAAGNPTRWTGATFAAWFGLPAIAVGLALLLYGACVLGRKHPGLWNVPEKPRFVKLSPEARAPFVSVMERVVGWVGVLTTVSFTAVQAGIYATATRGAGGLGPWVHAFIWIPFVLILALALRSTRGMAERIRAAADAEGIPPPRFR